MQRLDTSWCRRRGMTDGWQCGYVHCGVSSPYVLNAFCVIRLDSAYVDMASDINNMRNEEEPSKSFS